MKKILAGLMTLCMLSINIMPVLAASCSIEIKDVPCNYWAAKEIQSVVNDCVMTVDNDGNFYPEQSVTRIEFVSALLKVLSNDKLNILIQNSFTDVSLETPGYSDIMRSAQLGLVYGYPDSTFKPTQVMRRCETTSVISHITKDHYTDVSILKQFKDYESIPTWAVNPYAKTTHYGIYVNYPDGKVLNPEQRLTRAEAAVLLTRLKEKLSLVKDKYTQEVTTGTEHLSVNKKAPNNEITITNLRKIILECNVLKIAYECRFWSKTAKAGDVVNFVIDQNLYTDEGTLLIPCNTKLVATVLNIQEPQWFNKSAKVKLQLTQMILPDGRCLPINAVPFTKDRLLKEGPWMTAGKLTAYTLGLGAIGAGAGVGFAFIPTPEKIGTGLAIGIPVGCAVGLATGLVTKGLHYRTKPGEEIYVILTDDASVWN